MDCLRNEFISERERSQSILHYLMTRGYNFARGRDSHGQFSKSIRLVDFLKALFDDSYYEHMRTRLVAGDGVPLEEA